MLLHAAVKGCRRELARLGWKLIRWRRPKPGYRNRARPGLLAVYQADLGGSGTLLYMCPEHTAWRPRSGVELPVPAIPTFPSRRS